MQTIVLALIVCCVGTPVHADDTPTMTAGGMEPPFPLEYERPVLWEDTPDLNGLIATSEVIGILSLESEVANDFLFDQVTEVFSWEFWGGYFNYAPGDPLVEGFTLRVYDDGDGTAKPTSHVRRGFRLPWGGRTWGATSASPNSRANRST